MGNNILIRQTSGYDANITPFVDQAQRSIGEGELRGDPRIQLQKLGYEPRTVGLARVNGGEDTQMSAQGGLIRIQPLLSFRGKIQYRVSVGEEPVTRLGKAHPMRVALQ